MTTHGGTCVRAGEPTPVGGGWVHYPFMSSEDDTAKRRLEPKQIRQGTPMPHNMRGLCFELKGLMSKRVVSEFYLEQSGREYILAIGFLVPGMKRDAVKSNVQTVMELIAQHIHD